ncbi:MAG: hypothetical protein HPKKFMNG_02029 [Planctomycetes bacterium]|nr:hypothetical protein [Planctomycetota bacterium]
MSRHKKPEIALIYDFDGTLAPGNMQEKAFIPDVGMNKKKFWDKVSELSVKHGGDNVLMYMQLMIDEAKKNEVQFARKDIKRYGRGLKFFPGVEGWFKRVNKYAKAKGLSAKHYIISAGNKEMIQGTKIAKEFAQIYGSAFRYDHHGIAVGLALAINYTTKTQYLFRINKGALDVTDHATLNAWTERETRKVPFERMIFLGDGASDVPCMRLVKQQGGFSIAVYRPGSSNAKAESKKLIGHKRVDFAVPADYREGRKLDVAVKHRIDLVAATVDFRESIGWGPGGNSGDVE